MRKLKAPRLTVKAKTGLVLLFIILLTMKEHLVGVLYLDACFNDIALVVGCFVLKAVPRKLRV